MRIFEVEIRGVRERRKKWWEKRPKKRRLKKVGKRRDTWAAKNLRPEGRGLASCCQKY